MSDRFLVDTSVWIKGLRRGGEQRIIDWLREALLREAVVMAPPVRAEVLLGARDENDFAKLEKVLDALPMLDGGTAVWHYTASSGFRLRKQGLTVPLMDILIVAFAVTNHCVLVHTDRHFELIAAATPDLQTAGFLSP
ncbi:MAG: PIN domain-containing protein [Peptococcaceae bacterium]|jgi:predicted nucleic acid-binding protein|nr:PIN domain-containing protein [Peptococcaceae bacterium]